MLNTHNHRQFSTVSYNIMRISKYILTINIVLFLSGCGNNYKQIDYREAKKICDKVQGSKFTLEYKKQIIPNEINYIEYKISGTSILNNKVLDSSALASFCAIQLFRNLSSKTLKKYHGINIILNERTNSDVIMQFNKYYYNFDELSIVNKSANVINDYIKGLNGKNIQNSQNYIDTSIVNVDSLDILMKSITSKNIVGTNLYFAFKNITTETQPYKFEERILFLVLLEGKHTNNQTYLRILTTKNQIPNKIIGIYNFM